MPHEVCEHGWKWEDCEVCKEQELALAQAIEDFARGIREIYRDRKEATPRIKESNWL